MIVTLRKQSSRELAGAGIHNEPEHRGNRQVRKRELRKRLRSGGLGYIGRLRPFLSLNNLKLHLIALLQALVAFSGDGAVVDEYIRSIFAAEEAISLGVVEPLDGAFQSFHVRPSLFADFPEKDAIPGSRKNV